MGRATVDRVVAGVDIGGTRTKLALLSRDGRVVKTEILARSEVLDVVEALVGNLAEIPLHGLGVALPGFVDQAYGSRDLPGKLPGLSGRPLVAELNDALGVPVICLNDGLAATLGEWRAGAGQGEHDLVVMTLGSGVGSGVILDGRPLHGGQLGAGNAIGHLSIDPGGDLCLCGNVGCPETRISATAMVADARTSMVRGVPSSMALREDRLTFEDIVGGDQANDALATRLMQRFVINLGATLVSAVHAYGPTAIVLAGGIACSLEPYLPAVQRFVDAHAWRFPRDRRIPIRIASLGEFSGAIGVATEAAAASAPPPSR